ncbi:hypothetical protein PHLCEN_2v4274 [Hermanssonia centrifuga]|uniref:F-box domain-containing protein n=1 Tax=Hermanssonia centrifuga TaxID=98765 RepID=A0A2R6PVY4_9APHY|nr:hypothetical protein PHLCEN_2v4274 [Hermanssonia centrifuga]
MFPSDSEYDEYCSNFSSAPTTSALDRIGARIPEEVLGRILLFICDIGRKARRDLGQLALTCRYWASQCQPAIFRFIRLRSGQDLDELLALMASPLSRVACSIKTLWLFEEPRRSNAPWLHLVALRLVPKLSLHKIHLFLDHRSYQPAIRSIHDGLPRSHPSFSSHIATLTLHNARLKSLAALLHLVDEMPSLKTLDCEQLTWPMAPAVIPRQRHIPPRLCWVQMTGCTDNSLSLCVLTGRRRKARDSTTASLDFGLDPEQQHAIHRLVAVTCTEDPRHKTSESSSNKIDSAYNMIKVVGRGVEFEASETFYFILPSTTGLNSIVQIDIMGIEIGEYKRGDSDKWNKACEQLPPLQKLVLGFSSREDMGRFVREVVCTKLDDLRSANRVKYAVRQGHKWYGMWFRASVDSEELKGKRRSLSFTQSLTVILLCRNWL